MLIVKNTDKKTQRENAMEVLNKKETKRKHHEMFVGNESPRNNIFTAGGLTPVSSSRPASAVILSGSPMQD